jgi:hypothetical protein
MIRCDPQRKTWFWPAMSAKNHLNLIIGEMYEITVGLWTSKKPNVLRAVLPFKGLHKDDVLIFEYRSSAAPVSTRPLQLKMTVNSVCRGHVTRGIFERPVGFPPAVPRRPLPYNMRLMDYQRVIVPT